MFVDLIIDVYSALIWCTLIRLTFILETPQ